MDRDSSHLNLSLHPVPNPFCPSPSTGERGLEVRCHGDRPPLPVDLCVCVRVWHNGHVPAAALPELHSQDHHQLARLTIPRPRTRWRTAPPNQSAQQDKGRRWGGWVWVLLCLLDWNQNWNWTAITPITFIVTFFATNFATVFLVWRKRKTPSYSYLQFFVQMFNGLTSPFWWKGPSLLSSSASQGVRMLWFTHCWTIRQPIFC